MPQAAKTDQSCDYDAAFAREMFALQLDLAPVLITGLSGGPDSTALACLANFYAKSRGKQHFAVIVNHGIRSEAASEAERVQLRMAGRSIFTKIVKINSVAPKTGLQEWARNQRFAALTTLARQHRAILLLAHHQADQVETVLMRLLKGSGVAGLGGMHGVMRRDGIIVGRPLLNWEAHCTRLILEQRSCEFEDDPSNYDSGFERVRVRQVLANPRNFKCPEKAQIARFGRTMKSLTVHLELASRSLWRQSVNVYPTGYAILDMTRLDGLPLPVWHYWARRLIKLIGGEHYGASGVALDRLYTRLMSSQSATLGGCQFAKDVKLDGINRFYVVREIGRAPIQYSVNAGDNVIFAGCWQVKTLESGRLLNYGELNKMSEYRTSIDEAIEVKSLPYLVRRTIPVLCALDDTVIYPQIKGVGLKTLFDEKKISVRFLGSENCFYYHTAEMTGQ